MLAYILMTTDPFKDCRGTSSQRHNGGVSSSWTKRSKVIQITSPFAIPAHAALCLNVCRQITQRPDCWNFSPCFQKGWRYVLITIKKSVQQESNVTHRTWASALPQVSAPWDCGNNGPIYPRRLWKATRIDERNVNLLSQVPLPKKLISSLLNPFFWGTEFQDEVGPENVTV